MKMGLDTYVFKLLEYSAEEAKQLLENLEDPDREGIIPESVYVISEREYDDIHKYIDSKYIVKINMPRFNEKKLLEYFGINEKDISSCDDDLSGDVLNGRGLVSTITLKDGRKLEPFCHMDYVENKVVEVIVITEIGHQRKGENSKFHDDLLWGGPIVIRKEQLIDHWKKYFSDIEEHKLNFKKNIVNKFIEGETIVMYC